MNWMQFEAQWPKVQKHLRAKWGRLTDADLHDITKNQIKKDALIGAVHERYGVRKTDAEERLDEWLATVMPWALSPEKN